MKAIIFIILLSINQITFSQESEKVMPSKTKTKEYTDEEIYHQAWDLYKAKKYPEALLLIDKLIKKNGNISAYYEVKCQILIGLKRNDEIIATATKGIEINPHNAVFYDIRGNTYYFNYQPELARADYQTMISLDQTNARYFNNYLKLLNELRKEEEIINVFQKFEHEIKSGTSLKDTNFISDVYFYAALAYERTNNEEQAIRLLSEAIKISPDDGAMYYSNRGLIYQKQGKQELAIKDLNKAIEIDPNEDVYYQNRFEIFYQAKKYELARKDLMKAISLGKSNAFTYSNLALTYQMENNYNKACENYAIAAKMDPKNPQILANYAYTLFELDRPIEARENFEKAEKIEPTEIDILIGLSVCNQQIGDREKTKNILALINTKTSYKAEKTLLNKLMKEDYTYSYKLQKAWEKLF